MKVSQAPKAVDVLSQVAEAFRLRGSVSGVFELSPPWGYAIPKRPHAGLLVVSRGRIHFELEGGKQRALELAPGDVVALPHGHPYSIRDAPRTPVRPANRLCACGGSRVQPRAGQTEFISICCELAGGHANPVLRLLPPLIHCPGGDTSVARWLEPTVRLLAVESASTTPGRETILNRLAEVDRIKADLVQLRYFGGLTLDEAAKVLGISSAAADRYWAYARAWLYEKVRAGDESENR